MFDEDIINFRIAKLREYLRILHNLSKEKKEDFISNYRIYGLAERYLQLAIECVLDIGNYIISRLNLEKPDKYQDILLILGANSIIPKAFAEKIAKMAGFRNILVHDYLDINHEIVYDHLIHELSDFDDFIKIILKFLNNNKKNSSKNKI
ncbi:MAG: type VII toxin-antitoxin system HepT family RNase toxin [Candidatus Helarchaeota archaeon]